jgi:hypothetical protein
MSLEIPKLDGATQEELAQIAAEALAQLEPGRQPPALFKEIARLAVVSIVEVVGFRLNSGKPEVLLAERSSTEPWWPGTRSLPGSVQLPSGSTDFTTTSDYRGPVDGVLFDDFGNTVTRTAPNVHLFDVKQRSGARGSEQAVIAWTEVDTATPFAKPIGGDFFDASVVAAYPEDFQLTQGHDDEIKHALANLNR